MNQETPVTAPLAKYKLVFLGDQSVGKTSIINRFIYGTFEAKDHVTPVIPFLFNIILADCWNRFYLKDSPIRE